MLVDDDPEVRNCLGEMLARCGCQIISVSSGETALEVLRTSRSMDLILVDYRMPGMDGLELARRIRETAASLPVVLMTGQGDLEGYLTAGVLGIDLYIRKPIRLAELKAVINRARTASA